jgi:hypothetical protein
MKFTKRLSPYGIKVAELSGDSQLNREQLNSTQVIVSTRKMGYCDKKRYGSILYKFSKINYYWRNSYVTCWSLSSFRSNCCSHNLLYRTNTSIILSFLSLSPPPLPFFYLFLSHFSPPSLYLYSILSLHPPLIRQLCFFKFCFHLSQFENWKGSKSELKESPCSRAEFSILSSRKVEMTKDRTKRIIILFFYVLPLWMHPGVKK